MRGHHSTFSANEPEAAFRSLDYPIQQVAIIFLRIIRPRREEIH
jgi:hypothetical protein